MGIPTITTTPTVTQTPVKETKTPEVPSCLRFNLELGRNATTGATIPGRYEAREVGGRLLATWDAQADWVDSDWICDIALSKREVYVQVFFYPYFAEPRVELEIVNHAPNSPYGWLARGMRHSLEVQFPQSWTPPAGPAGPTLPAPTGLPDSDIGYGPHTTTTPTPASTAESSASSSAETDTAAPLISAESKAILVGDEWVAMEPAPPLPTVSDPTQTPAPELAAAPDKDSTNSLKRPPAADSAETLAQPTSPAQALATGGLLGLIVGLLGLGLLIGWQRRQS